jgi:hypothetical protein
VWYELKVDLLIAGIVFSFAGFIILILFAWEQAAMYVASRRRIFQRLSSLVAEPRFFTSSFAISRNLSRIDNRLSVRSARDSMI